MKLLDRHEFASLPIDEMLLIKRWSIRVATITPVTADIALPTVRQFRLAGGNEEVFAKLEQHVCETGCSFIQLLSVVVDLLRLGIVK